jgi:hypothetical protein
MCWSIGAVCARQMENLLIIYCFTAPWPRLCGILSCLFFGVSWVMPRQVRELIDCWQGGLGWHQHSMIWKAIPHCLMWCLWRERNLRSFEDTEMGIPDLKLPFFWTLYDWMNATGFFFFFSKIF